MNRKVLIFSAVFFFSAFFIFLYEFFLVKNPFMDALPPFVLWGAVAFVAGFWLLRMFEASSGRK